MDDDMGKHRQAEIDHEGTAANCQPFRKPVVRLLRAHSFRWIGRVCVGVLVGACRVFAHSMNDGSMFSAFASYSDRGFAKAHDEVLLQTPGEKVRLKVIAIDIVDSNV